MNTTKNDVTLRGYVNFLTTHKFQSGDFSFRFSMPLAAGKTADGNYRKEYINVQLGGELSREVSGRFGDGDFIQVEGRLRNQSYEKDGEKKTLTFVEGFSLFRLKKAMPQQQAQVQQAPVYQNMAIQPQQVMPSQPMHAPQPMQHHQGQGQQQWQQAQQDLDGIPF